LSQALGGIAGGRVLDLATGQGGFVELLREELSSYERIIGVDRLMRMLADAPRQVGGQHVHFAQMDAGRLGFGTGCFDTVALSASLHHLSDMPPVLAEIERVLRPAGHLVVAEMHSEVQTEAQGTSVAIHHWAAGIDLALGWPHYPTLTRQEIVDRIGALALANIRCHDWSDLESDPHDPDRLAALEDVIGRYLQKAQALAGYPTLVAHAEVLRRRLAEVGAQSEPRIVIIAEKVSE
jgi:SAM-dependent methyltransferase